MPFRQMSWPGRFTITVCVPTVSEALANPVVMIVVWLASYNWTRKLYWSAVNTSVCTPSSKTLNKPFGGVSVSTPMSECGGLKNAGGTHVWRIVKSETPGSFADVPVTNASSQPVVFGTSIWTTKSPDVFAMSDPVSGVPSRFVSARGFRLVSSRVAVHPENTSISNVSFDVPRFTAVTVYSIELRGAVRPTCEGGFKSRSSSCCGCPRRRSPYRSNVGGPNRNSGQVLYPK